MQVVQTEFFVNEQILEQDWSMIIFLPQLNIPSVSTGACLHDLDWWIKIHVVNFSLVCLWHKHAYQSCQSVIKYNKYVLEE